MNIYEMSTPYLREQVRKDTPHSCNGQGCIICHRILRAKRRQLIEVLEEYQDLRDDHLNGDEPEKMELVAFIAV